MNKELFEYSNEIVVSSIQDKRVQNYLSDGWTMDKVENSADGLFFVIFKREKKQEKSR